MTAKTDITRALGETDVLLPGLLAQALAANDRIKLRLTLLQAAAAAASSPAARRTREALPPGWRESLRGEMSEGALDEARLADAKTLFLPGVGGLLGGLKADLAAMLAPLATAEEKDAEAFALRVEAMQPVLAAASDQLPIATIAELTRATRDAGDSFHLLVMDLHKALNQLAARAAAEDLDGAKAYGLTADDRPAVRAFMRGLHRTAPLAFGHPGLGTVAVRSASSLTIQNDIGTTDAHVLVVHVTQAEVTVTYTDIHRPRATFFMDLFEGRKAVWTPLAQRAAAGLEEDAFFLVTGRFGFTAAEARDEFLEFLGSRLVFLIDWNKARKALQIFVGKKAAVDLLAWAAGQECGHRAFLELGGAELVYDVVGHAAAGRIRYGERLDAALGEAGCVEFLRHVLRSAAEGLAGGRSARLVGDELQAELSRRFASVENAVFGLLVRHLGLTRCIAEGVELALAAPDAGFAPRAKRIEAKADRLTADARDLIAHVQDAAALRLVIDEIENSTDAMEDCAYLLGVKPLAAGSSLLPLAGMVTGAVSAMVRAVQAASRLPAGQRADAVSALQAIDAVLSAEREADTAERDALAGLLHAPGTDAGALLLQMEVAKGLELATDRLSHAAFALRDRVLAELSA